jgi:hypothetical protein
VYVEILTMDLRQKNLVSVHPAESEPEAMVIRSLLEANGIHSPGPELVNPLLLKGSGQGLQALEVYVSRAQADAARSIIAEYLKGNASDFSGHEEAIPRPVTSIDRKRKPNNS